MTVIETYQLTKRFGKEIVVDHINLTVHQNEIFGFLGRNGAGKSTFINMLTGIIQPTSGSFNIFQQQKLTDHLRRQVGVLPDYSSFYNELTALQHLKYFSRISHYQVSKNDCLDVLEQVGLEDVTYKKVGKFSFGMKKKLGIAQAIIHQPDLIFLDEPTSGLDIESALHIHELISHLHNQGKTIFLTSHNLAETEKICTRIAIMENGTIANQGTMRELRQHYDSTIHLTFKHRSHPESEYKWLKRSLMEYTNTFMFHKDSIEIELYDEQHIPHIIRLLSHHLDIYDVKRKQPSLEEIFMNTATGERNVT